MPIETIFTLSPYLALPFWFLMIVLPKWKWTRRIIGSPYIVVPAALVYAILTVPGYFASYGEFDLNDLAKTAAFFGREDVTVGNWLHFVAVDLFVGRWVYLDSRKRKINVFLSSVLLFVILNSTPTGLLIYLVVRAFYPQEITDDTYTTTNTNIASV